MNSLGISLKWDVYDWGQKRHLLDEKQRNIEQSHLNLTETQSQVVIDLDNRFRKLREARASLKVAQLGKDAEKEKLQVVMEQYKQKAALLSTLQTEQATWRRPSAVPASAFKFLERASGIRESAGRGLDANSAKAPPEVASVAGLMVAGLLGGCESQKKTVEAPPIPVTVAEVQEYSGAEGVNYSASIVPYDQLPVAFKSAGYVTSILQRKGVDGRVRNLQQGDWVKKGAVLATVRQTDYQHAVEQYKGQLEQAQAGAEKSKQDFGRAQALYNANAMTQTDYDAAKAQYDSSQGAVTTAQAAVAQAQQALNDCELRAPMDGQILSRNIELGALVGTGTAGFTMGDTRVKALFGVPDTVLASVALGKKQAIETETYQQQFYGPVTAVAPQADQKSRTFQVEVTVPNPKDLLKSGMIATLILGKRN